jgi:hypothetical protein
VAAKAQLIMSPAKKPARLRLDRSTVVLVANAVNAASAPPTAAKMPKWCVCLVGVRARTTNVSAATPSSRRLGPSAAPRIRPRRNSTTAHVTRQRITMSTGSRRVSEPSGLWLNSRL